MSGSSLRSFTSSEVCGRPGVFIALLARYLKYLSREIFLLITIVVGLKQWLSPWEYQSRAKGG